MSDVTLSYPVAMDGYSDIAQMQLPKIVRIPSIAQHLVSKNDLMPGVSTLITEPRSNIGGLTDDREIKPFF